MAEERTSTRRTVTSHTLKRYLQEIARIPPLEPDEEKRLARRVKRGDRKALKLLVESNLKFVVSFAKRYRGCGLSFLDLINEGNLGLMEAAKRFDPGRDVRFLTYAVWWIRQSILHALQETAGTVRLPQKQANLVQRLEKVRGRLTREMGRRPGLDEIAAEMGLTASQIANLMNLPGDDVSLDSQLGDEGDFTLADRLEQDSIPSADLLLLKENFRTTLREALKELAERERRILSLRFGLEDQKPRTLKQIGEMMGLSRERIRQIESQALKKLKNNQKCQWLRGYLN